MAGDLISMMMYSFMMNRSNRSFIKKGTAIKLGDKEVRGSRSELMQSGHIQVEYNPKFKLFLHTKMSNPHYKPELQVKFRYLIYTNKQTNKQSLI